MSGDSVAVVEAFGGTDGKICTLHCLLTVAAYMAGGNRSLVIPRTTGCQALEQVLVGTCTCRL